MRFYFDEHMPRAVEKEMISQGHEVIMAVDVGMQGADDDTGHLMYATEHEAVLVTRDLPFVGRASKRTDHSGVIGWTGHINDIGGMIKALTKFAYENNPEDIIGQVFWLK